MADRLAALRAARFIGRRAETDLFRTTLATRSLLPVFYVHGPGGIGKTTLLREFERLAREAGRAVIALDGRDVRPSGHDVLRTLAAAAAGAADGAVLEGAVVLIDTYEALAPLDAWFRETLLPDLPASAVVAIAGRRPPSLPWRTDPAWAAITRVLELDGLEDDDSIAFLEARGVDPAAHARIVAFTRGHPLALALFADVLADGADAGAIVPEPTPDIVGELFGALLDTVPAGPLREALDISALVRVTTGRLLRDLLGADAGAAAFDWLRAQSYVDVGPAGLVPHDLVRDVVLAEARWRDARALHRLSRRVFTALYDRIREAAGRERERLQRDVLFVARTRPTYAPYFDWQAGDDVRSEPATAGDTARIVAWVERHEGAAPAALAREWLRSQPHAFRVFRDADDAPFGFLALLDVGRVATVEPADPAAAAARAFMDRYGPLRPGEAAVLLRWWLHAERYQDVTAAVNLTAAHVVAECLTRPGIAWSFVTVADAAFWADHFQGVNFPRAAEADFEAGGRRYGVFAHDWRVETPADWSQGVHVPMPFADGAAPHDAVHIGVAEFRLAVREALRDFTRPDRLAAGRLRFARVLAGTPDGPARGLALQVLLREAVASLETHPRDARLHRAVWYTYIEPLPTQERAAERLALPFSTYRHHLRAGIERIAAWLWQREQAARRRDAQPSRPGEQELDGF